MRTVEVTNHSTTQHSISSKNFNFTETIAPDEEVSFSIDDEVFDDIVPHLVKMWNESFGEQSAYDINVN